MWSECSKLQTCLKFYIYTYIKKWDSAPITIFVPKLLRSLNSSRTRFSLILRSVTLEPFIQSRPQKGRVAKCKSWVYSKWTSQTISNIFACKSFRHSASTWDCLKNLLAQQSTMTPSTEKQIFPRFYSSNLWNIKIAPDQMHAIPLW